MECTNVKDILVTLNNHARQDALASTLTTTDLVSIRDVLTAVIGEVTKMSEWIDGVISTKDTEDVLVQHE